MTEVLTRTDNDREYAGTMPFIRKPAAAGSGTGMAVKDGMPPVLQFPALSACGGIRHAVTTRAGGVSEGHLASLNLSFSRGDREENVRENFRRTAALFGVPESRFVFSDQTHTANVRFVTEEDAGKGLIKPKDYHDIDGLVTAEPGLALFTFYADCVPLYLADTKNHVIGLSHSGWRGTVNRMGEHTLRVMKEQFGTDPAFVRAAIGPSICGDCYEVGPELKEEFEQSFGAAAAAGFFRPGKGDRQFLDLWKANHYVLREAGVPEENISVTDICTKCNSELLFSHRVTGRQRGSLAAVMMIR